MSDGILTTFKQNGPGHGIAEILIRLAVAYQADGTEKKSESLGFRNKRIKYPHVFHFAKQRKTHRLEGLLWDAGLPFRTTTWKDGTTTTITKLPYASKRLQDIFTLSKLSSQEAAIIYEECLNWDGCNSRYPTYCSFSKDARDFIQYCASMCGLRAHINKNVVGFSSQTRPTLRREVGKLPCVSDVPARNSYCFQVPTGYWLARRWRRNICYW